jgi:hypothetical protein
VHKDIIVLSTEQPQKQLCGVQWPLDALRSKETFDNVIFTDETFVEMGADGKLFFTRELQIWIFCQLKR